MVSGANTATSAALQATTQATSTAAAEPCMSPREAVARWVIGLWFTKTCTQPGNVFVDPHTMPGWVQAFVKANPITHLATAARGLMHGTAEAGDVGWVLVWSAALVAVFAPLALRLYNAER